MRNNNKQLFTRFPFHLPQTRRHYSRVWIRWWWQTQWITNKCLPGFLSTFFKLDDIIVEFELDDDNKHNEWTNKCLPGFLSTIRLRLLIRIRRCRPPSAPTRPRASAGSCTTRGNVSWRQQSFLVKVKKT